MCQNCPPELVVELGPDGIYNKIVSSAKTLLSTPDAKQNFTNEYIDLRNAAAQITEHLITSPSIDEDFVTNNIDNIRNRWADFVRRVEHFTEKGEVLAQENDQPDSNMMFIKKLVELAESSTLPEELRQHSGHPDYVKNNYVKFTSNSPQTSVQEPEQRHAEVAYDDVMDDHNPEEDPNSPF